MLKPQSWLDYEQDLKARDRVRDFWHGCIVFMCVAVVMSLMACNRANPYEPEQMNAAKLAGHEPVGPVDPSLGRVSAHRFSCPAYDGSGTCVCDAEETMTDWGEWAFRELLILP